MEVQVENEGDSLEGLLAELQRSDESAIKQQQQQQQQVLGDVSKRRKRRGKKTRSSNNNNSNVNKSPLKENSQTATATTTATTPSKDSAQSRQRTQRTAAAPACARCREAPRTVLYLCCMTLLHCTDCHQDLPTTMCSRCAKDWNYFGFVGARFV